MPRVRTDGITPQWQQLEALAAAQGGYFSLREAQAHHIGSRLLLYHVGTGRLRRVGQCAFQFARFEPSRDDDCAAAWLWSRGQGVLSHHSALWLHGLLEVRPAQVYLTLPPSWRRTRLQPPRGVRLYCFDVLPENRVGRAPLPYVDLDAALIQSAQDGAEPALVEEAFLNAWHWGLRSHELLRLWLHPYHPLRQRLMAPWEPVATPRESVPPPPPWP